MVRIILFGLASAGAGGLLTILGFYVVIAHGKPELKPWHELAPKAEYNAADPARATSFEQYLHGEARLFDEIEADRITHPATGDRLALSRYDPDSRAHPSRFPRDWNRTFELRPMNPVGGALLLHGLSDSPYSWRALARVLRGKGYYVLGLRIPGHGTVPGALAQVRWKDWTHAVRLAAARVRARIGPGKPLILGGFSNGAALAVEFELGVLEGEDLPAPSALVLISPALTVSKLGVVARIPLALSHLPGLKKLAWLSIYPEYNPFKYNSFPVNAGLQIHQLTRTIAARLEHLETAGKLGAFAPTLAIQSAVDSTVGAEGILHFLQSLGPGANQLILFDVNRRAEMQPFMKTRDHDLAKSLAESASLPFSVTLVTNIAPDRSEVVAGTRAPISDAWRLEELGGGWPPRLYSLSHVALPFAPDDPLYGDGDPLPGAIALGRVEPRGETNVLKVPLGDFLRLRYNPFFDYMRDRIVRFVEETGGSPIDSGVERQ
jgi:alpha-beta hydrolase superfamily lysophospholipase